MGKLSNVGNNTIESFSQEGNANDFHDDLAQNTMNPTRKEKSAMPKLMERKRRAKEPYWNSKGKEIELYKKQADVERTICHSQKTQISRFMVWGFLAYLWAQENCCNNEDYRSDQGASSSFPSLTEARCSIPHEAVETYRSERYRQHAGF